MSTLYTICKSNHSMTLTEPWKHLRLLYFTSLCNHTVITTLWQNYYIKHDAIIGN